jgi:hypothetical protein
MLYWLEKHLVITAMIMLGVLVVVFVRHAEAQDHHPLHADHYSTWTTKEGGSCCSSRSQNPRRGDCAPIDFRRVRMGASGIEVWIDDEWLPVRADKVRPYHSPDGSDHLCNVGKVILCFVPGGST